MSWLVLNKIPYATWKSTSKALQVDQNIKVKRTTFAARAAKANSIKIRSSTQSKETKAQEHRRDHIIGVNDQKVRRPIHFASTTKETNSGRLREVRSLSCALLDEMAGSMTSASGVTGISLKRDSRSGAIVGSG